MRQVRRHGKEPEAAAGGAGDRVSAVRAWDFTVPAASCWRSRRSVAAWAGRGSHWHAAGRGPLSLPRRPTAGLPKVLLSWDLPGFGPWRLF